MEAKHSVEQTDTHKIRKKSKNPNWNKGSYNPMYGRKGSLNPAWKGGKPKCPLCGEEMWYQSTQCKSCKNKSITRENSHFWKGGTSFEPYPLEWNNIFKEEIRKRDKHRCQHCGKSQKENGRKLDIHHKDYNKKNIDPNNLISLCRSCHSKTNHKGRHNDK